jgi:hypothetical protein
VPVGHNETFEVSSTGSFFAAANFSFIPASATPTASVTPSKAFVESAALQISGPIAKSFRPMDSDRQLASQLAETGAHADSDRFDSSESLGASELAQNSILSTGAMVGIVLAAVAVVVLVVGLVAWRLCSAGSTTADSGQAAPHEPGGEKDLYQTGQFLTNMNPNAADDLSDELMDDEPFK